MEPFTHHRGIVAPLDRANVDTDAIIPKQYLKAIHRTGFGVNLFDDWRYLDRGEPGQDHSLRQENPNFVLNQGPYRQASLLVARENFGCGSSREHAVWALMDFGIRVVIAASFADIFYNNCFKNGLLPVVLPDSAIERLMAAALARPGFDAAVDLPAQTVTAHGETTPFEIEPYRKDRLLQGLDDIALTLQQAAAIRAYEERRRTEAPWLFQAVDRQEAS
ncbi:MAG: 3-isopropylmalate dehydratase small subunit [Candidatus Competibacterales bacterium]